MIIFVFLCVHEIDIGVMSGAIIFIKEDLKISDIQIEILVGILNLYCLVGSFAAGRISDWIGRRYTIVFANAIFFVGSLLMGFSTNYAFLMFGRFVAGIGVGFAITIALLYTVEISPASSRGFLTSFPEVFKKKKKQKLTFQIFILVIIKIYKDKKFFFFLGVY